LVPSTDTRFVLELARAGSEQAMEQALRRLAAGDLSREQLRKETKNEPKKAGRPKHFTFQYKDKSLPFSLNLAFRKPKVEKREIIDALRELLRRLEAEGK
jgi:hypothetical protein